MLQGITACEDSYQCRFGQQCCKETKSCKATCSKKHEKNVGLIIGIVGAVVLGNALFWITFCCLCLCKGGKKSAFRYRTFGENENNREASNNDDVIDNNDCVIHENTFNCDTVIHQENEIVSNNDTAIYGNDTSHDNDRVSNETINVLGTDHDSRKEQIALSIIRTKRPILKSRIDK